MGNETSKGMLIVVFNRFIFDAISMWKKYILHHAALVVKLDFS